MNDANSQADETGLGTWDRRPIGHPDRDRQCPFCRVIYVDEAMMRDCRCYRPLNLNEVPPVREHKIEPCYWCRSIDQACPGLEVHCSKGEHCIYTTEVCGLDHANQHHAWQCCDCARMVSR